MKDEHIPRIDRDASMKRVKLFADAVGAEPPSKLLDDDGGPAMELLGFVAEYDVSLDWIFLNDARCLIIGLRSGSRAAA